MTAPVRQDDRGTELRFAVVVTIIFALLNALLLSRHEMWRDELQAWMIARDSASLLELYRNTRYEGHTSLWFLLLFALSRVTRHPAAMQVLHGVIATGVAFVIARWAPFSRTWRVLLPFGYYFAFGWAVVSRPYALAALLFLSWCAVRRARPSSIVLPAVLLALLANTSVYGALLAGAATLSMLVAWTQERVWRDSTRRTRALGALGLTVVAAIMAALWVLPPRGHVESMGIVGDDPEFSQTHAMLTPFRTFGPVAGVWDRDTMWRGNGLLFEGGPRRRAVAAVGGTLLLLAAVIVLRGRPDAMAVAGIYAAMHLAFDAYIHRGASYHDGVVLLALIGGYWLWGRPGPRIQRVGTAVLGVQVIAAIIMVAADLKLPFSANRDAAAFLERTGRAQRPLVSQSISAGVSGYLDRPIYYADRGQPGTFIKWNLRAKRFNSHAEIATETLIQAKQRAANGGVLLVTRPIAQHLPGLSLTLVHKTETTLVPDERMYVYDVRVVPDSSTTSDVGRVSGSALPPVRNPQGRGH